MGAVAGVTHKPAANLIADSVIVPAVRIGASTYSREPFPKQIEEARENGYDYVEFDLTWVNWEPEKLREEAAGFAKKIPLETAHFPASHFQDRDLARFAGFMDALAPVGTRVFNVHLLQARSAPTVSVDAKIAWLADLAKAAKAQGVTVTVENLDETPQELRRGLGAGAGLAYCLDGGPAHLDKRAGGGRAGPQGPRGRPGPPPPPPASGASGAASPSSSAKAAGNAAASASPSASPSASSPSSSEGGFWGWLNGTCGHRDPPCLVAPRWRPRTLR